MTRLEDANADLNLAMDNLQKLEVGDPYSVVVREIVRVLGSLAVTQAMLYDATVSKTEQRKIVYGHIYSFRTLPVGSRFEFVDPPQGFTTNKLIKLDVAPGFAMADGWDFALSGDKEIADFKCALIANEPPRSGFTLGEDHPAYPSFVRHWKKIRRPCDDIDTLSEAWETYRLGWDACDDLCP